MNVRTTGPEAAAPRTAPVVAAVTAPLTGPGTAAPGTAAAENRAAAPADAPTDARTADVPTAAPEAPAPEPPADPPQAPPASEPAAAPTPDRTSAAPSEHTVPRQHTVAAEPAARIPDALEHPDPRRAADASAAENLLRCWVRESGVAAPLGDTLRIPLRSTGTALLVPVRYWSATGWHRFGAPVLESGPAGAPAVDAVTLAALLGREAPGGAEPAAREDGADLVGRVADSVRRTAEFIADRRARPTATLADARFLDAEQSLVLGHPLHPTPKSREGLSEAEARAYSPELRGSFPLHWMAVDPSVLAADSAWTERGRPVSAEQLAAELAGITGPQRAGVTAPELPRGTVPLPLHPWQARELRHRPAVAELLGDGLLHDLGPYGPEWHPTSSVRTVHRPAAPAMLKLSLGLRITNSRRENLLKELRRGVEVHRLLRSGLGAEWQRAHPAFDIVRDPAWLAVRGPDGAPVPGLDVMIRHNPFRPGDDVVCVAGLVSPRPWPGRTASGVPAMRSRLAQLLAGLAIRTGRPVAAVAAEWFLRYLEAVVRPVLWLDGAAGVALEAHQQNTLVLLDPDGWPAGGRYRDNQGYYFRRSRREELDRRLPGIGVESDSFVSDEVTDERFAYYLGINNVLGLVGAFGSQRLVDERVLLAAFRRFLAAAAAPPDPGTRGTGSRLPALLLESATLRCKANLLTRLRGLDELVGPVDTQSVYVSVANPLAVSAA